MSVIMGQLTRREKSIVPAKKFEVEKKREYKDMRPKERVN